MLACLAGDQRCAAPHRHPSWHQAAAHRAAFRFAALANRGQGPLNHMFWMRAGRPAASRAGSPLNERLHPAARTFLRKVVVVRRPRAVQRMSVPAADC